MLSIMEVTNIMVFFIQSYTADASVYDLRAVIIFRLMYSWEDHVASIILPKLCKIRLSPHSDSKATSRYCYFRLWNSTSTDHTQP